MGYLTNTCRLAIQSFLPDVAYQDFLQFSVLHSFSQ